MQIPLKRRHTTTTTHKPQCEAYLINKTHSHYRNRILQFSLFLFRRSIIIFVVISLILNKSFDLLWLLENPKKKRKQCNRFVWEWVWLVRFQVVSSLVFQSQHVLTTIVDSLFSALPLSLFCCCKQSNTLPVTVSLSIFFSCCATKKRLPINAAAAFVFVWSFSGVLGVFFVLERARRW